jgi:SNF2 family DNA or RNA helicase
LNLTASSNTAIIELEWTSTKEDQAEDRAHRIGQVKTVNIWYLLAADTLEEDMAEILDEKRKTLSEILDGKNVESEELLTMLLKRIKERRK